MAHTVFLNYRRTDVGQARASRVADELGSDLGKDTIFFDSNSITAGDSWDDSIVKALGEAEVFIPLIGRLWQCAELAAPSDYVRREIREAIKRKILILPILLDGAEIPGSHELPPDISQLSSSQGLHIDSRSEKIFSASMRVVSSTIIEQVGRAALARKNEKYCEFRVTRPPHVNTSKIVELKWLIFVDGALLMTLEKEDTFKTQLLPIGVHMLQIEFREFWSISTGGPAGSAEHHAYGLSEPIQTYLGPGKYEFGLKKRTQGFWRSFADGLGNKDSAPRYLEQKSYEPW